jgi:hypothetical protein
MSRMTGGEHVSRLGPWSDTRGLMMGPANPFRSNDNQSSTG